jgi:hypothetical protein
MTQTNRSRPLSLVAFVLAAALAGCGGGGGSPGNPPAGPTACPAGYAGSAPNCVAPVTQASATGKVVDFDSDTPLANEPVSIAPYTIGAAATQVATTAADGSFAFSIAPGNYLLQIGSNSATPADNRATLHAKIALVAGSNALVAPTPPPEPQVAFVPSQLSPNFRLVALSPDEADCLSGMNAGRIAHGFPTLVPDELLQENARMLAESELALQVDVSPLFNVSSVYAVSAENFKPCDTWTNGYSFTPGTPPFVVATNPRIIWYGADIDSAPGSAMTFGAQEWFSDPRS